MSNRDTNNSVTFDGTNNDEQCTTSDSIYVRGLSTVNVIHVLENIRKKMDETVTIERSKNATVDGKKKQWKKWALYRYRGFLFTLLSSLCFSFTALVVKYLHDYNPINLALWRYQGAFLPAVPIAFFHWFAQRAKEGREMKEIKCGTEKCSKVKATILLVVSHIRFSILL